MGSNRYMNLGEDPLIEVMARREKSIEEAKVIVMGLYTALSTSKEEPRGAIKTATALSDLLHLF